MKQWALNIHIKVNTFNTEQLFCEILEKDVAEYIIA